MVCEHSYAVANLVEMLRLFQAFRGSEASTVFLLVEWTIQGCLATDIDGLRNIVTNDA
jgi:hypothetical protein